MSDIIYSVVFVNNSSVTASACLYQTEDLPSMTSVAWITKFVYPTTKVVFQWSQEYDFVWFESGRLNPGIILTASQVWKTDMMTNNRVTFTCDNVHGAYTFKDPGPGETQGRLYMAQDGTIPVNKASIGYGMAGSPYMVTQASPNLNIIYMPQSVYWITFGDYTQGQVLDVSELTNQAKLEFPSNTYSLTAILNQDNTWSIKTTAAVNAEYLADKEINPLTKWGLLKNKLH